MIAMLIKMPMLFRVTKRLYAFFLIMKQVSVHNLDLKGNP